MISIPMLLTRRGWLGWATPYFLSLFVRLASLHALSNYDSHPPSSPTGSSSYLPRYFIRLFSPTLLSARPAISVQSINSLPLSDK